MGRVDRMREEKSIIRHVNNSKADKKNEKKLLKIRAVVFDQDGLMFDTERIVKYSWTIAGRKIGYENIGENIYNTLGLSKEDRRLYFMAKYGESFPFDTFSLAGRDVFVQYITDNGLPIKPGLFELLEWLKSKRILMGVATSSSTGYVLDNLEKSGAAPYFTTVISGNMVTRAKPEPDIYIKACESLQVDPKEAVALEDAPGGIRAAFHAGMNPIMIPDLKEPDDETQAMLFGRTADLTGVIPIIEPYIVH